MWQAFGSNVEVMTPEHHDLVLAITSHVPHLIAYNIVGTAADLEEVTRSEVIKYSAGGFRDFTRIAASDPTMWRDVFLHNKEAVLEMLGRFNEDLTALQRMIRRGDGDGLFDLFTRTRAIRRNIVELGQETPAAGFRSSLACRCGRKRARNRGWRGYRRHLGRGARDRMTDFWVFGYGSLMWRPGFPFKSRQKAILSGWRRRLCIYSHVYRGTKERPGLVLGLDEGGECAGVAFRVEAASREATIRYLRDRELVTDVYIEKMMPIELESGKAVQALTYVG